MKYLTDKRLGENKQKQATRIGLAGAGVSYVSSNSSRGGITPLVIVVTHQFEFLIPSDDTVPSFVARHSAGLF